MGSNGEKHSEYPLISIIMPVRNEARFIGDTLLQLVNQDYPADRYEIIVCDGMSDDSTREIVGGFMQQYPQIQLIDNPAHRSSSGRNLGFKTGKGDYFLVVDGHCFIPTDQLLRSVADCFSKSGADCLGRPQPLDPPGLTCFQRSVALARASWLGHGGDSLIFGEYEGFASPVSNGAAYRREVFDKVGYVDETFDAAEDVEFNYRVEQAGLRCYTSPLLTVRYYPRENMYGLFRQMLRYGKGRRKFTEKHPSALTVNQLVPAFFVTGLITLVLALMVSSFTGMMTALLIVAVPYVLYAVLLIAETIRIMLRNGAMYAATLPAIIIVIHFALGYGFLKQMVSEWT